MARLYRRIRAACRALRSVNLRRIRRFGSGLEFCRIRHETAKYLKDSTMPQRAEKYHARVLRWLAREYGDVVERWRDPSAIPAPVGKLALEPRPRIWTLWLQGRENAPEIVKQCIASMERNRGEAELVVLDSEQVERYLDIDPEIRQKVARGDITRTEFSNYVRLRLLYTYGGLWLDSTIWVNRRGTLPCFEMPFYTIRSELGNAKNVSQARWASYVLGGFPNSPVFGFLVDMYSQYFRRETMLIDYLLLDFMFALGYESFPWFRALVDGVPLNNQNRHLLLQSMRAGDFEEAKRALADENQWFYKNSYKHELKFYPEDVLFGRSPAEDCRKT